MANKVAASSLALISNLKTVAARAYHAASADGEKLIQGFEGLRLKAYQDIAGVWTIGWGNTHYANGKPVKKGDTLPNRECADDLLEFKLKGFAAQINNLVKVTINQNQFDALLSFQYNTGALAVSTLLKKLNAGDFAGAAAEFGRWNKVTKEGKKVVSQVLTDRRAKEAKLFLKPL
ncbi:lysozyme [Mucilaginibacter rubeus]|uniref:Lysozyme n=1 Tax=Mucilaginibacter rubeus TaxID=2027860 RepID=A0A5C1I6P6_9SPHI|nr:lysozyme [Mucilaginibacter rubeus]QEM13476.1 lysozyme [Mucilaginibacter rubeus]